MKPKLRGWLHQEAFFVALGASLLLMARSNGTTGLVASLIYSLGLLFRLDVAPFIIAKIGIPNGALSQTLRSFRDIRLYCLHSDTVALIGLPEDLGREFLILSWLSLWRGHAVHLLVSAPKWVTAILYVACWTALPYLNDFNDSVSSSDVKLLIVVVVCSTL